MLAACGTHARAPAAPANHVAAAPVVRSKVVLVSKGDLYLEGALLLCEHLDLVEVKPEAYQPHLLADARLVIFDDYTPDDVPAIDAIYFAPQGPHSPIAVPRRRDAPHITDVVEDDPLMRDLTLTDVQIASSDVFAPEVDRGERPLASSQGDPVIAVRRDPGRTLLAIGFSLTDSDLGLRTAFPLLIRNAVCPQ